MEPSPESASTRPTAVGDLDRPVAGAGPQVALDRLAADAPVAAVQRDGADEIVGGDRAVAGARLDGQLPGAVTIRLTDGDCQDPM